MKAKKSPSGTPKGSKNACIGSKMRFTCGGHLDGVFWTESGQFGPSNDHFRGEKAIFGTICGLKTACFAHVNGPLGASREGPKVQ